MYGEDNVGRREIERTLVWQGCIGIGLVSQIIIISMIDEVFDDVWFGKFLNVLGQVNNNSTLLKIVRSTL